MLENEGFIRKSDIIAANRKKTEQAKLVNEEKQEIHAKGYSNSKFSKKEDF